MSRFVEKLPGGEERIWNITISVGSVKMLKRELDVDLAQIDEELFKRIQVDPILACDIIYVLVKPQADAEGVSPETFYNMMLGDLLYGASGALIEALVDFFPNPARRRAIRKAFEKGEKLNALVVERAEKMMDSGALEKKVMAEMDRLEAGMISGSSSTNSPDISG